MSAFIRRLMMLPPSRELGGWNGTAYLVLSTALVGLVFYNAGPAFLGRVSTEYGRGLFLLLVYALVLMRYPASGSNLGPRVPWYDWLLILATSAAIAYWIVEFRGILTRAGAPTTWDLVFGSITVLMSLEVARRALGWAVTAVAGLAIIYALFGDYFPIDAFAHSGLTWATMVSGMFSLSGIFGFVLDVIMSYVVMFVIVGALLQAFGAGSLLIELPFALCGRFRGGPGIASVAGSTLFGMISGSATANTAATGAFTIPIMKRAGYPPHVAGAIEPAASTGGMFMPPIMGAGAFIMADITGVPYLHIVAVSVAPALIYFLSVAVCCYTEAGRHGIRPIPIEDRPEVAPLLKSGWYYLVPIFLLIWLMVDGYTPQRAAYWAVIATVVLSVSMRFVQKPAAVSAGETGRSVVRDLGAGLRLAGNSALVVAALTGAIGIIVAVVFQTGVGFMLTSSVLDLTGGSVAIAILMSLVLSYVLGMGMPVTAVYILLAVLFGPALKDIGIPLLAAHMMLFWFSQSANISPPVAVAAFVGAGIAGADPLKTSLATFRYAMFLFIMPILFVYTQILMPDGFNAQVALIIGGAALSTIPFAAAFSGFLIRRTWPWERCVLFIAALGLVYPELYVTIIGLVLLVGCLAYQWRGRVGEALPTPTMQPSVNAVVEC